MKQTDLFISIFDFIVLLKGEKEDKVKDKETWKKMEICEEIYWNVCMRLFYRFDNGYWCLMSNH